MRRSLQTGSFVPSPLCDPEIAMLTSPRWQVVAKMKHSHLSLIDLVTDGFRFIQAASFADERPHVLYFRRVASSSVAPLALPQAPPTAFVPLLSLRHRVSSLPPYWFNSSENYQAATSEALNTRAKAIAVLGDSSTWTAEIQEAVAGGEEGRTALAERMLQVAEFCAQSRQVTA